MAEHPHPPIESLLALTGEEPAPGEPSLDPALREHLRSCPTCDSIYRELVAWREAVRRGDEGDAPEQWVRKARERMLPRRFMAPLHGAFKADVMFDSGLSLAVGTRADALQGRQWVLATERLELEISLAPDQATEEWPLTGQVLQAQGAPVALQNCRVVLMESGQERERATSRETGEFLLRTRPSGAFQIRIEGDDWSIETPPLEP